MPVTDVFSLALFDRFLIYAPLHHLSALVNRQAAVHLRHALATGVAPANAQLAAIFALICAPVTPPAARSGPLDAPFFLGILPTRRCNMLCRYAAWRTSALVEPAASDGSLRLTSNGAWFAGNMIQALAAITA